VSENAPTTRRRWRSGPKPKPPEKLRKVQINMRLTEAEAAPILARAERAGLSPGRFVYELVKGREISVIPEPNRAAYAELARLAANLNQAMHAVNEARLADKESDLSDLPDQIADLAAAVDQVRRSLLGLEP